MHVLLVEPNEALRNQWSARLETENCELALAVDEASVRKILAKVPTAAAFVRFPLDWANDAQETRELLKSSCHSVVALTDGSRSDTDQAYSEHFVDCLDDACGNDELRSKLAHAEHLEQLEHRLAQAQKLESIGELAAGIAHEINTPIQYIGDNTRFVQDSCGELMDVLTECQRFVGQSESASDELPIVKKLKSLLDEADIEYLIEEIPSAIQQTIEGVDRVSNIVRAMKEFAHPGVSEMVPTDLSKSIENTLMVARNEWKYVADAITEFDPELPSVPCLPGEFNQVLLNMIVNAAHAIGDSLSDTPGAKGTIRVTTHLRGSQAEVRISDSGTGISPSDIEQIFTPFFTTKAAGKGTGQGLAIAHSVVVEKHGGSIKVESEVGSGTTFVIQIPVDGRRESSDGDSVFQDTDAAPAIDAMPPSRTPQEV